MDVSIRHTCWVFEGKTVGTPEAQTVMDGRHRLRGLARTALPWNIDRHRRQRGV
jgi:hypothetical protein